MSAGHLVRERVQMTPDHGRQRPRREHIAGTSAGTSAEHPDDPEDRRSCSDEPCNNFVPNKWQVYLGNCTRARSTNLCTIFIPR
jgi:hypothetical protein